MFFLKLHTAIIGGAVALGLAGAPAEGCGVATGAVKVAYVTERGEIRLDDGRLIRLAGLDIPGGGAGGFDAGPEARSTLASVFAGAPASLALLAPRPDRWGRWLADLALPDGRAASTELLGAGLASVRPEFETRGCETERLTVEAAARAAGLGLWNDPDTILDATDLDILRAHDGHFAFIEGVVTRVGVGRSRLYIDFGRRGGFTAVVTRKLAPAFQRGGIDINTLAGATLRVRGVLENRFGPQIEIGDPVMIERLDPGVKPRETKSGG